MTQMPICLNDNDLADTVGTYFMSGQGKASSMGSDILGTDTSLVFCFDTVARKKLEEIVYASGYLAFAVTSHKESQKSFQRKNIAAILFDMRKMQIDEEKLLEASQDYCRANRIPLIIIADVNQLDSYYDYLNYAGTEWVLASPKAISRNEGPSHLPAEIITSLSRARRSPNNAIFENSDGIDLIDLKKISADVERISRALAQLSEPSTPSAQTYSAEPHDAEYEDQVSDVAFKFRPQSQNLQPFDTGTSTETPVDKTPAIRITSKQIRDLIKARRLRDKHFKADLFADPAWDMLLDLMAARLEDKRVSVSSLCIAANVPPTTALRWIKTMTAEKIFQRRADTQDGRRIFIELSNEATASMIGYFSMLRRSNLLVI